MGDISLAIHQLLHFAQADSKCLRKPCWWEFVVSLATLFDIPSAWRFSLRLSKPVYWASFPELADGNCLMDPLVDCLWEGEGLSSLFRVIVTEETKTSLAMLVILESFCCNFFKTIRINTNGGKVQENFLPPLIWNASCPLLNGSGFHDIYCGSWSNTLDASKSICRVAVACHTCLNILGFNFHTLESLVRLDSLSAFIFIVLGIYSAVIDPALLKIIPNLLVHGDQLCVLYSSYFQQVQQGSHVVHLERYWNTILLCHCKCHNGQFGCQ